MTDEQFQSLPLNSQAQAVFIDAAKRLTKESPLISLCLIAGNVEKHIARCLKSFAPLYDEVIVVRAIGSQIEDRTLEIAACDFGALTGHYHNKPEHEEWPHTDDFAAARNLAWGMATGDWLMWADTDDIISPEHAKALRAMVEEQGENLDLIKTPYVVPEAGYNHNLRERIVRRGISRWVGAVHECLAPIKEDDKWRAVTRHEIHIVHAPDHGVERGRGGRNLRILQSLPESELNTSLRYHLFSEHCVNGNIAEAALAAEAFLTLPEGGRNERFEILLWMSMLSEDKKSKRDWAQLALAECPNRREAYIVLADIMLNAGHPEDGAAYHRAAGAQPLPSENAWNLRPSMWGWKYVQQGARIARTQGRFAYADALELNHFIRHDGVISLLHATRGRPQHAAETRELWLSRAEKPDAVEHIFGCDPEDEHGPSLGGFRHIVQDEGGGPCGAWNMASTVAHGKVLVQVSDDMIPPHGWDRLILQAIGDASKPAVLRVSDGHRTDGLIVLAIVTRAWVRQQGYLFHPDFFSMYSDNWLTECAEKAGAIIEARDIVFEHRHPVFTGEAWHPTTAASNAPEHYAKGLETLNLLRAGNATGEGVGPTGIFAKELLQHEMEDAVLAEWIAGYLPKENPVHDLGCGSGYIAEHLNRSGFRAIGYEGEPLKPEHVQCDLSQPMAFDEPGSVVCIEVGEHVPKKHESVLLDNVAAATADGGTCILSWALPKQPGRGHVNCQENEYIIERMRDRGFVLLKEPTWQLRAKMQRLPYLQWSLLIFAKENQ